jgi:hypothetical protein
MNENLTRIDELILEGGIEVASLSESGDFLYKFTDKLKDIDPEIYNSVIQMMYREIIFLWENGFISMDITASNPSVTLTDKASDEEAIKTLPESMQLNLLAVIKSIMEQS